MGRGGSLFLSGALLRLLFFVLLPGETKRRSRELARPLAPFPREIFGARCRPLRVRRTSGPRADSALEAILPLRGWCWTVPSRTSRRVFFAGIRCGWVAFFGWFHVLCLYPKQGFPVVGLDEWCPRSVHVPSHFAPREADCS